MSEGYIKLFRKITDSVVYQDSKTFHLWCHCLLKANHKTKQFLFNGEQITIKRGQFITGRNELAKELNMKSSSVYRRLKILEKLRKVNIEANNKFSIVTIIKYSSYQSSEGKGEQQNEQQVNNKRTTSEQQVNTNKNEKNEKNEKKESESVFLESFQPKKLFKDSELYDFDTFQTQFTNHPDYNNYDARHYYSVVRDYSASSNKMTADWIAYAYQIVRRNNAKNEAVKNKALTITEIAKLAAEGKLV